MPDKHGFAGPAAGVHNGALIVAGGANFPSAPPWEGGDKVWHDQVFVLERDAKGQPAEQWLEVGTLPKPMAYGAVVSTDSGMLIIGGETSEEPGTAVPVADVYRLTWDPAFKKIRVEELPALPRPAAFAAASRIGAIVYVVAAERTKGADRLDKRHFWSLDLDALAGDPMTTWQSLPPHPGSPRHKAIAAVQAVNSGDPQLFLISGENPRYASDGSPDLADFDYLTDGYRFDPRERKWTTIAELPVLEDKRDLPGKAQFASKRWPVAAGTGIGVGESHILVFGGTTGRDNSLPMEERPLVPSYVLAYHTITDRWSEAGEMPVGVVTTSITRWGDQVVIPSGETRPGVRTNRVQALRFTKEVPHFGAVNFGVLIAYLGGVMAVGGFFALRTHSTDDYFRGGQRVPYWVAGLSIFATMLSSISYVSIPALAFRTDWVYYLAQWTIIPIALVVVKLAIPFFRHIDATSAYEYLEKRFSYPVRLVASLQFILFQIGRMAIVMYLPALALAAITPLSEKECVLIMGVLSIVYCTFGGVEAVVWTDAIQAIVLMGGLLIAIVVVLARVGDGPLESLNLAYENGKLNVANFDFSPGSYMTNAVWVVLFGQFFQSLYSYTSDQAVVQRYLTTSDERGARNAMWTTVWMNLIGGVLFFVMGSALYVFYKHYPFALQIGMKTESIFPLFIANELPIGVSGLVVAGIFAAAQSTISTSMNSTSTAIVVDFCVPFGLCRTDGGYLNLARALTVCLGVAGIVVACWLVDLHGASMIEAFIKIVGLFGGAVCGLFMLGILTKRANAAGGLVGSICGFVAVLSVMLWTSVQGLLFAMIGTLITMAAGYGASLMFPAPSEDQLGGLTWYDRPEPSIPLPADTF
jgi:solute:Na+ symporter, SSS family